MYLSVMEPVSYYTPPVQEGWLSNRECQINLLKHAECSRDFIRELRWLVVHYDPSTHKIAKHFVNKLHIYPENKCNEG